MSEDVNSDTGTCATDVTYVRDGASSKLFIEALCKVQSVLEGAKKDSANPHFRSTYADLESCWVAVRGPLAANGFAVFQAPVGNDPNSVTVTTRLMHTSGAWMSFNTTLPVSKADAQGHGSAITYARRYGLMAAIGLTPTDDDGNAATGRSPQPKDAKLEKLTEDAKQAFRSEDLKAISIVMKAIEEVQTDGGKALLAYCEKKLSAMEKKESK